ncbi:hypothetical protein C0J52_14051 [Blattella germanica]|nr:hypothetical protein C0J52_14051 [Blattella germanica]
MYSSSTNNVSALIDEIALEGLDGITLEGLWTRLDDRPTFTCALNEHSKSYLWNIVRRLRDVEMYELREPRAPLIIFNRYNYVDPELGMVLEPNQIPEDIYPHCPVEDAVKKVRGSCSTYRQRRNIGRIARKLSYQDVMEKWGSRLVIVAKQEARNIALMGLNCNPHLDLTIMQYCVLERIGRSRYMGEVTQGKVSLQVVVDDPKALFYHRKFLMKHKLVVKQVHHQKSGSQNCTGSLMHLPRFRVDRKPKALFLTEKVIEILKTRPNYIAEYEEIRKELGLANSLKKLFKTLDFQRYVRTDLRLPYRALYPSASVAEWKHKGNDKEKRIRAVQLINPDMDVREIWTKDDDLEEDDEAPTGVSDQKDLLLDRPILSQAYVVIEHAGPEGLSQMQLSAKMGVSKLQSRTLCRNLLRKGAVVTFMNDVGRQRVFRYMSKKFQKEGKMSIEFNREKNKMLKLVGKKKQKKKLKSPNESEIVEDIQESGTKRPREEDDDKEESPVAKKAKISTENESVITEEEQPQPGTSDETQNILEHNIETEVLEVMMGVPGVKDYQASFTEELLKIKTSSKETPSPNITYRILRRANMIIEAVRAHKVIDDLTKLMKHIYEEEDKEGYNVKIDKKSLLRLLVKLSKDGHIKVIKIVLKGGEKEKMLSFVCEPYITTDHTIIQSAIEQAKMKFFILGKDRVSKLCAENAQKEKEDDTFSSDLISKSMKELKSITSKDTKLKTADFVYDSVSIAVKQCWPVGWAIMCDLLLRLPLCIFVKVFNVTFVIPDLEEYLNHPIRKNYLVKHLPTRLRNSLIVARRYIFSIHEVMQRLCYIGLIQFGPQRLKEKDQVFIYLNCKTTLLDTTTSKPSYHQVSDDIQYAEHKYEFHSLSDVEKYWYEMWNFCIHTQLGGRLHVTGKDIVLEVLQNKQVMIEAIQPRQPLEAPLLDNGEVPGDKRGAAGLDSAFFSHLKRNWNWNNHTVGVTSSTTTVPTIKPKVVEQRKARLASLKPEPINLGEIFQKNPKKITKSTTPFAKKKVCRKTEPKPAVAVPKASRKKKKNVIRHVLPRKIKKTHRPYYDEVDMKALQLMSKLRVEWSTTEDNLLLLCKVASMYLCPNPRKQVINFQMIRDILHNICPASSNKTSRACQRRILYMMKNSATAHSVALHLEDVRQDPNIIKQFKNTIQELRSKTDDSEELEKLAAEKFKVLVNVLQRKFNPQPSDYNVLHRVLPETIAEFRKQYELVYPSSTLKKRGRFQDVKNVVDIYCAVVNAIIHSSLCCVSDKISYTYQLFQVYQQYPDNLLRSAMAKIRGDQMVSLKKSYLRLKQKTGNYLPVSSSPYQLSISYVYQLQTRYQYDIFYDSHVMSKKLCEWYEDPSKSLGLEAVVSNGGTAAALMTFDIDIPEQVIILDPRVSEKDETYARIVQVERHLIVRYRDILRSYRSGKDVATSSVLFKKPFMDLEEANKDGDLARDREGDPDFVDVEFLDADNTEEVNDQSCSSNQQTAIARAASRIALYMMREELGDAMVGEKQHAHDFFVVNSCKVFCSVSDPPGRKSTTQRNEVVGMDIDVTVEQKKGQSEIGEQMEIDQDHVQQISISENENDMMPSVVTALAESHEIKGGHNGTANLDVVVPEVPKSQDVDNNKRDERIDALRLKCGSSERDINAPLEKTVDQTPETEHKRLDDRIEKESLIIKSSEGSETINVDVNSDRGDTIENENQKTSDDGVQIQSGEQSENEKYSKISSENFPWHVSDALLPLTQDRIKRVLNEIERSGVTTVHYIFHLYTKPWLVHSYKLVRLEREKQVPPPQSSVMNIPESCDPQDRQSDKTHDRIRAWRRRRLLATAKEVERAVQSLDLRPWVRVDGSVNRRVLDRILGAVLGHCMYMPGASIQAVADHFTPALQPFQVRELIEILQKLGSPADGTEDEGKIAVNPQPDAVLRLGQFIGDKTYNRDFLSMEE